MSVVIVSNNMLDSTVQPLGNINGLKSSQDWVLFLDFTKERYLKKINNVPEDITLLQALTAEHNFQIGDYATPKTMLRDGTMKDVATNDEIRTWLSPQGNFGVLTEPLSNNSLVSPFSPISRTASLPPAIAHMASVLGAGSMTITGDNIQGSPIKVTESGGPIQIKTINPTGLTPVSIAVDNLQHYQIGTYEGFAIGTTPIGSGTVARARKADSLKINPNLLSNLQLGTDYTIILQQDTAYARRGNATTANSNESRLVVETNTHRLTLGVNRNGTENTGQTRGVRIVNTLLSGTAAGSSGGPLEANDDHLENFAYKVTSNEIKGFGSKQSGIAQVSNVSGNQVLNIYLGSGKFIATKLVVYKRALTDAEIVAAVSSWL
ncbi:hypothetical protein HXZ93_01655 [Acinetobacter pseudolwoffii]|uniref:hypothetical protein n=1 Tax=Acinetobacter pseudolwoffii TaxID=2053287 RepID=UPI0025786893|nr:hypothetical protein [Acinetobacter pseudolwoffii]MDM1334750.1 hypothetical protein [Acinetobacter pseudolwoffii]